MKQLVNNFWLRLRTIYYTLLYVIFLSMSVIIYMEYKGILNFQGVGYTPLVEPVITDIKPTKQVKKK